MPQRNGQKNKQCRDAIVFLLLSAILIAGVMMVREKPDTDGSEDIPVSAVGEHPDHEEIPNEEIPNEVSVEAVRLAEKQWKYVSDTFEERNYTEYRLDSVDHVLTCHDVEDETFEVYGIACSYRREGGEEWEQAENAANRYFIFRSTADGTLEWQCDVRSYHEPQTVDFKDDLHEALMGVNEQYMFKLLANESLEKTLEESLHEYLLRLIPGDYFYFGWKQLAYKASDDSGQTYGVLLCHSASGSPLIYSEETERYGPAIYSTYLLPVCVSYQKDSIGRYVVTECWEPSKENYEQDIYACFPADAAELVLENLDEYATDLLIEYGVNEGDAVFDFFPGGPIWPEYSFDEALDDLQLCALVDYYPEGDIYYTPIRDELTRRICNDPVSLLNGLGLCHEEIQNTVCRAVAEQEVLRDLQPEDLTDEGRKAYEKLVSVFGEEI